MYAKELEVRIVAPLQQTSRRYYVLLGVLLASAGLFGFAWLTQLRDGLIVTGMRDIPGGSPWGLYVSSFIFYIGLAHAGIAIAAAIRLLGLRKYAVIGRMAELLTLFGLLMAGLLIVLDLGRPDRIFQIILHFPERVASSPLVWDITAIFTYLVVTIAYIFVEIREDLARLRQRVPWPRLYGLLLWCYDPGERKRVERILWWASLFIIPIMVMVHSTVGWIFGLQVGQPGWYNAIAAPYFLLGALLSGLAAVVIVVAVFRFAFGWQSVIGPDIFRGLGLVLSWFTILYLYFLLAEFVTVRFAGSVGELDVQLLTTGERYAWAYWLQAGALLLAFGVFFAQRLYPRLFSISATVVAATLVVGALWFTRFLITVPPLERPFLPYPTGTYAPTWVEWSLVSCTITLMVLLYTVFAKLFPLVSLYELRKDGEEIR